MEQGAQLNEGQLSRMRAALVNEKSLADLARKLGIGAVVRVGKGERKTGGVERDALLADVLEAVIGAVFVDGGYAAADALVGHLFAGALAMDMQALAQTDYKTELQELTQEVYKKTPNYLVSAATGPDHKKQFEVMVKIGEKELGRGRGASKKRASQAAASAALAALAAQENGAELPELDTKAKEKGDGAIARRLSKRST
jgi:ribonuclease-3